MLYLSYPSLSNRNKMTKDRNSTNLLQVARNVLKTSKYKYKSLMKFPLMAALLHLGPKSLPALGELADIGVVSFELPLLGLIHLLVLVLHVAAELARGAEPLVKTARVAGDTDVPFLLGLNQHLPPVDGSLVPPEG